VNKNFMPVFNFFGNILENFISMILGYNPMIYDADFGAYFFDKIAQKNGANICHFRSKIFA
jgi:hypothetical protein